MITPLVFSQRIYNIVFGWRNKKQFGFTNRRKKIININLELFVAIILVHELLHERHPRLKEEEIVKKTWRVIDWMRITEIRQLAKKLLPDNFNAKKQIVSLW